MNRTCPTCPAHPPLQSMDLGGVELDSCTGCHGIWIDGGEWASVFGREEPASRPAGDDRALPCPACGGGTRLRTHSLTGLDGVVVDRCTACGGTWLDQGEMAAIRRRGATRTPPAAAAKIASTPHAAPSSTRTADERVIALERPHPKYWSLVMAQSAVAVVFTLGLALPFVLLGLIPVYLKYHTTRYTFDEEGVGVSWGVFFHHATYLTYDKIQDIHLNRGLFERWMGLGTIEVQTAAGSSSAEITLFGLTDFDAVRDFLYRRMRGAKEDEKQPETTPAGEATGDADVLAVLQGIRDEVTRLREALQADDGGRS